MVIKRCFGVLWR